MKLFPEAKRVGFFQIRREKMPLEGMLAGKFSEIIRPGRHRILHAFIRSARAAAVTLRPGEIRYDYFHNGFLLNKKRHQRRSGHQCKQMRRIRQANLVPEKIHRDMTLIAP